ncbi:MAG: hypothetical protein GY711_14525 [bacterium]|nr:hypothetical protein [bacterium]
MVSLRRFGPLMGAVVVFLVLTLSRLFDIQVREHDVWAREAVNLVRSATIEPYRRGEITARGGEVLVRDQEVYELEFVWRDFRRGHALGQVAMLRSLLLMRPVSLEETREWLHVWADDFLALSPAEIDAFGRGESIAVGEKFVPRAPGESARARRAAARAERRWGRSRDLHFYIYALLDLDRRERRAINKYRDEAEWERPYVELQALIAGEEERLDSAKMAIRERVHARLEQSFEHLARLASRIDWATLPDVLAPTDTGRLIVLLESTRRYVEDTTADELFRRAAGFGASRLDAINLARLDLDWLRRCLYWDTTRLEEWIVARGELWPRAVEEHLAGHAIARFKLGEDRAEPGDRVLSGLAHAFRARAVRRRAQVIPRDWRRVSDLVVIDRFRGRFMDTDVVPDALLEDVLPFQGDDLRAASGSDRERLGLALRSTGLVNPYDAVQDLWDLAAPRRLTWDPEDEVTVTDVLLAWDRLLQERIAAIFEHMPERVQLASDFVDAALEDRPFVVRDRGARPQRIATDPPYDLVHLVTRHPPRYAGFHVRSTTRRVPAAFHDSEREHPVARELIGRVRAPYLVNLLKAREFELQLFELQRKLKLLEEDRAEILDAIEKTYHAGEFMGGSGIEGYFNDELTGINGYRESQGLQDQREGNRAPIHEPPRDGHALTMTLDLELSRVAQAVLEHPEPTPADEERPDRVWWAHPVGAIALITPAGDVLVAASTPLEPGKVPGPGQDGQRLFAHERTLRQYTFHPPGSVFKPFVAAWAIEKYGASAENFIADCVVQEGDHAAGFGRMHCHARWGHGEGIDLHNSLVVSCNSYFAALGELIYDGAEMREMAHAFGFNRPTGIRSMGDGRTGLFENHESRGFLSGTGPDSDVLRQRLANGLAHISSTPLQVARAYAGLSTGDLPELRLVSHVEGQELPAVSERLPIGAHALEIVRRGLADVVKSGSASGKRLDEESLGFTFSAKTGSADYISEGLVPVEPRAPLASYTFDTGVRKHTWVAGWFPSENPVAILVVYLHDTSTTSSHSAVYVASQFLRTPEVRRFVEMGGRSER